MLDRTWDSFNLQRWREDSDRMRPYCWEVEVTREVEQLRQVERRIAAATGWNSSTLVIGRVLRRLRGDVSGS